MVGSLPKAFELQGLRRLKEALVGSGATHGKPGIFLPKLVGRSGG
jgi:hypothetical protein